MAKKYKYLEDLKKQTAKKYQEPNVPYLKDGVLTYNYCLYVKQKHELGFVMYFPPFLYRDYRICFL